MPEFICSDCGKRLFHENETTLKIEETIKAISDHEDEHKTKDKTTDFIPNRPQNYILDHYDSN